MIYKMRMQCLQSIKLHKKLKNVKINEIFSYSFKNVKQLHYLIQNIYCTYLSKMIHSYEFSTTKKRLTETVYS